MDTDFVRHRHGSREMAKKCILDAKYNQCPHLRPEQVCGRMDGEHCSMEESEEPVYSNQRREPRWYEKYYEGKSRRI